jgi:hypothetical protein
MTLIEAKTVAKGNRIYSSLNSNNDAQIINGKDASPLLLKVGDLTLACVTESIDSVQRLFENARTHPTLPRYGTDPLQE